MRAQVRGTDQDPVGIEIKSFVVSFNWPWLPVIKLCTCICKLEGSCAHWLCSASTWLVLGSCLWAVLCYMDIAVWVV